MRSDGRPGPLCGGTRLAVGLQGRLVGGVWRCAVGARDVRCGTLGVSVLVLGVAMCWAPGRSRWNQEGFDPWAKSALTTLDGAARTSDVDVASVSRLRSAAHVFWPLASAASAAVSPYLVLRVGLAPSSRRRATAAACPAYDASCSAYSPDLGGTRGLQCNFNLRVER